ncbi:MAG: ATP-binding protein [Tenuifilaceae bacterium]
MNNRWTQPLLLLLLASLFFFLSENTSLFYSWFNDSEPNFQKVEIKLNQDLLKAREYAFKIQNKYSNHNIDEIYKFYYSNISKTVAEKEISLFMFFDEELIFWNNSIDVNEILYDTTSYKLVQIQNTWYVSQWIHDDNLRSLALVLLKHDYPYQNRFLKNIFNTQYSDLDGHSIVPESTENTKKLCLSDGTSINLIRNSSSDESFTSTFKLIFQWLVIISLLVAVYISYRHSFFRKRPFSSALFLAGSFAFIRVSSLLIGFPNRGFFTLFSPEIYAHSILSPSLGDFLVNSVLVFIVILLFYRSISTSENVINNKFKIVLSLIASCFVWGMYIIADSIFSSLIMHSTIILETYRVFDLSIYSLLGYISVSLWIASSLLITDLWVSIFRGLFNESKLAVIALVGFIIAFAAALSLGVMPSVYGFLWSILAFMLLFWFRYRLLHLSSTWFLVLISLLSFYAVFLVSDYSYKKDRDVRKVLAINLSNERDPVAEMLFSSLQKRLESDTTIHRFLGDMQKHEFEMFSYLQKEYFNDYFKKYDFRATVCYPGSDLIMDNTDHRVDCNGFFNDLINVYGISLSGTSFYFLNTQNGRISYIGYARFNNQSKPSKLYIELDSKLSREVLGYPELLLDGKLSNDSKLSNYSTAKYHNEILIAQTGTYPYKIVNTFARDSINKFLFINQGGYSHLFYRNDVDDIVILSRPRENILNTTASFAYIFFFFYLSLWLWFKSANFPLRIGSKVPSFKLRIKTAMIIVVLLSLILVATVSILYSIYNFRKKNVDNLSEKLISVMVDIEKDIVSENLLSVSNSDLLSNKLIQLSNVFYTDINLYDVDGDLLASSRPEIFERKLQGKKMNSIAWYEMAHVFNQKLIHEEQIGGMSYFSAYVPLIDQDNNIIAYLNLPYFTRQRELVIELYSIIVAIINIYVLLTLFAFAVAVFISNQISKPLELIREKLRNVDISGHNEQLNYRSNDEVGMLVKEYNRMVIELADSAEKLARSQRESAWREMAKQIAHEIKNPLTPMKLSLQHLIKAKREGVEDWDFMFQKFSASLIDQINTLSNIATEFSNFAKMPASSIVEIDMNSILDEALTLFSGYNYIKFSYINKCSTSRRVSGDREQLFRVFVNLIKNAVQSIERGKKGEIKIELSCTSELLVVLIADNGRGIPEDLQPKLFSPNFTTKSGGMGLGLAIVKGIVESSGGKIRFETNPGIGTKFIVELPLIKDKS